MKIEKLLPGIQKNISLKKFTTFKIGGRTKYFFVAKKKENIIKAVRMAKKINLPSFILGGGSNLLISDKGFKGIIIKIQNSKLKIKNYEICAEAGVQLSLLVNEAIKNNLSGLEWAIGIPGTVGGAIHGNSGLPKESMGKVVGEVEAFDSKDFKIKKIKNKDCRFGYRDSVFKHKNNLIILSAILELEKGNRNKIKKKIKKYLERRKINQPLNFPSAGSVFKNFTPYRPDPRVGTGAEPRQLKNFKKTGTVPAAWLIEKCNLKGKKIGNVKISEKHANFIVNLGNGKANDVKKLINLAKNMVKNKFGVVLEEEIQYLGF